MAHDCPTCGNPCDCDGAVEEDTPPPEDCDHCDDDDEDEDLQEGGVPGFPFGRR